MTLGVFLFVGSIARGQSKLPASFPKFFKEGHRGGRGLMPENTIPAMLKGLQVGANVLELDVYLTADGQVLVAHDPFVNAGISQWADGKEIKPEEAKSYAWHQMKYEDIKKIDVGLKPSRGFPAQQKMLAYMPLLGELIDSVEAYAAKHHLQKPLYNIEFKTQPSYEEKGFNATPAELSEAVLKVVTSKKIRDRYYIQSFDPRPLQYIHDRYPKVVLGYLTDRKSTLEENIKELGFTPSIYSPHFNLVNKELVDRCKAIGMKLVPWTVNGKEAMRSLVDLGVDGIITDNPHYFTELGL